MDDKNKKIIDIGEWQLRHLHEQREAVPGECDHKEIELDGRGNIVRCVKCNTQLSAFWALVQISNEYNDALTRLQVEKEAFAQVRAAAIEHLAAKKVDAVWRSGTMVPACPHCERGILPEDGLGDKRMSASLERRRRQQEAKLPAS